MTKPSAENPRDLRDAIRDLASLLPPERWKHVLPSTLAVIGEIQDRSSAFHSRPEGDA